MKSKAASILIAASLALFGQSAFASTYIPCDNCTFGQQATTAISHGVGRYVVGNVLGNDVNAFRVYLAFNQNAIGTGIASPNGMQLYSDDGVITAAETAAFSSLVAFYNAAPVGYQKQFNLQIVAAGTSSLTPMATVGAGGLKPSVTAPGVGSVQYPTPGINAYNVLNGGPQQNQFLNWVGNLPQLAINSTVSNLVGTSILRAVGASPWSVGITIYFTDGSHIGAYVDMTQTPAALLVNPASAIDSHGNNIPASKAAVSGTGQQNYSFGGLGNSTDQPNMKVQIVGFGISVPPSNVITYGCVTTLGGTTCTAIR